MLFHYLLIFLLFPILILFKGVRSLYFLQLKEYRYDRLKDFFLNEQGYKQYFSPLGFFAYLLMLVAVFYQQFLVFAVVIGILDVLYVNTYRPKLRFKPTLKSILIFISFCLLVAVSSLLIGLQISYLLYSLYLILAVAVFTPLTYFAKESKIRQAKLKVSKFPDLIVIGITGSYGKSSTKEFLAQVLSHDYKVLKTPKNINTEIGIANLILSELDNTHQVFVVEMGAYSKGEIARSAKIFNLDFAVITAMADQHLALFGTLEKIRQAKSEIASTLKSGQPLYLNLDSQGIQTHLPVLQSKYLVKTYGTNSKADYLVENVQQHKLEKLSFKLNKCSFSTSILGSHNAVNLAPVIAICQELGISEAKIQDYINKLTPLDTTLSQKVGLKKSIIFDDSYNSNPEGFLQAIDLVKTTPAKKKILLTMGMVELGSNSDSQHSKVAEQAMQVFDQIFITKPNLAKHFTKNTTYVEYTNPDLLIKMLSDIVDDDSVILIENRLNSKVYNYLLQK